MSGRQYRSSIWVVVILAFVWLVPPDWIQRSDGHRDRGLLGLLLRHPLRVPYDFGFFL